LPKPGRTLRRAALERWAGPLPFLSEQSLPWLREMEESNLTLLTAWEILEAVRIEVKKQRSGHSPTHDLVDSHGKNSQAVGGFSGQAGYERRPATQRTALFRRHRVGQGRRSAGAGRTGASESRSRPARLIRGHGAATGAQTCARRGPTSRAPENATALVPHGGSDNLNVRSHTPGSRAASLFASAPFVPSCEASPNLIFHLNHLIRHLLKVTMATKQIVGYRTGQSKARVTRDSLNCASFFPVGRMSIQFLHNPDCSSAPS
jgi:hypothetical protein